MDLIRLLCLCRCFTPSPSAYAKLTAKLTAEVEQAANDKNKHAAAVDTVRIQSEKTLSEFLKFCGLLTILSMIRSEEITNLDDYKRDFTHLCESAKSALDAHKMSETLLEMARAGASMPNLSSTLQKFQPLEQKLEDIKSEIEKIILANTNANLMHRYK